MDVDFDRFEDALDIRAEQSGGRKFGMDYAYKTGYLLSLLKELSVFNPQVADRVKLAIKCLEQDNLFCDAPVSEDQYMAVN